jgi:hypothetical protein
MNNEGLSEITAIRNTKINALQGLITYDNIINQGRIPWKYCYIKEDIPM